MVHWWSDPAHRSEGADRFPIVTTSQLPAQRRNAGGADWSGVNQNGIRRVSRAMANQHNIWI
jgi:hypothetical protein